MLIGAEISLMVLSALSFALRLFARRITCAGYWWDDYAIMVALETHW